MVHFVFHINYYLQMLIFVNLNYLFYCLHLLMKKTEKCKQDLQNKFFKVERYLKTEGKALSLRPKCRGIREECLFELRFINKGVSMLVTPWLYLCGRNNHIDDTKQYG